MIERKFFARAATLCAAIATLAVTLGSTPARAEKITMKLHHFGSSRQPEVKWILAPLRQDLEKRSGGTLTFQTYYGMSLGGKPRDLINQTINGVVDMAWTLPAFHAGRFPILAGVELPFIAVSAEVFSQVAWDWLEKYAHVEFKGLKVITMNTTDAGILHTTKNPVRRLEDLKGLKIRVTGRIVGMAVKALGGVPVQIPLPSVYESLARGQTQGVMIPWQITLPFKLLDVTKYHTDMPIYHSVLMTVMNRATWDKMDARQKKAVEQSTGKSFAKRYGIMWDKGAIPARDLARKKGNEIIKLSPAEEGRWRAAAKITEQAWIGDMNAKGLNGKQMFADLLSMVKKYSKK